MTADQIYKALRQDLIELAGGLGPEQLATPVPALPGWTVQDTIAHLTGVCADIADGHLVDPKDPHWTARHVSDRAGLPIGDVTAEWARTGPQIDEILSYGGGGRMVFMVLDVWHHTQDIRNTLGRPAGRDDDTAAFIIRTMAELNQRSWIRHPDRPCLTLTADSGTWQLGDGEPVACLTASDYELARILIGRRSAAQMLAADWSGDAASVIAHLPAFGPPAEDLLE